MQTSSIEETAARRSASASAPTLLARLGATPSIVFTRLRGDDARGWTAAMSPEAAFTFCVALMASPGGEVRVNGKHSLLPEASPGALYLWSLADRPTAVAPRTYDVLRIFLPAATLDQLNFDRDLPRVGELRVAEQGRHDPVLHGLALATLPLLCDPGAATRLLVDSVALAVHAHVARRYGETIGTGSCARGGLLPWQLRRVREFIEAHLDDDPSIQDLARECRLSGSHFARAFRQAAGVPPHRWLTQRRIERAKAMLQENRVELAEIALACGFVDQSHLTRAFAQSEGCSPGKWRKLRSH